MEVAYVVIGLAFGFIIYKKGLEDGIRIKENKEITPIITKTEFKMPFKKEEKEEIDPYIQGLENILNYTGDYNENLDVKE